MGSPFLKSLVLSLILGALAWGVFPSNAGCPEKLTIAYIGDEIGRLEPCG